MVYIGNSRIDNMISYETKKKKVYTFRFIDERFVNQLKFDLRKLGKLENTEKEYPSLYQLGFDLEYNVYGDGEPIHPLLKAGSTNDD